ncbi:hypothetical protein JW949_02460, partial [Candidatus Woesearchaeota archaeon]|nr:hypothetical protein [Candidatus Woesearchaeota archaeon]
MNKRGIIKRGLIFLFIFFIVSINYVLAAAPDLNLNTPSEGQIFSQSTTTITLNITATDADGDDMNVSFYKGIPWDLTSCSYDNVNIPTQDNGPQGLFFSSNGIKLYEVGGSFGSQKIYQYTCSDAWNLSSCSYDTITLSIQSPWPTDLFFSSDGTKLYELDGYMTPRIHQYTCSDAWNLSSCSYDTITLSTTDGGPTGMFLKSDGTKIYEIGRSGDKIYQYTCSDAWNLSSCSYDNVNISTQDND